MSAGRPAVVRTFPPPFGVTPREQEVANLIARGLTHAEIGRALKISRGTVGTYSSNLMKRVGLTSTAEITHFAIWAGITPLIDFSQG